MASTVSFGGGISPRSNRIRRYITVWLKIDKAKVRKATVLLIKFLPSLPVTAQRGSAPSALCPPERATSGIATCSVVGDTYSPVAKLSPALGWWTLPCLACLWALCVYLRGVGDWKCLDFNSLRPRQMDAISQTTFSTPFSWMKMFELQLKFHWNMFLKV